MVPMIKLKNKLIISFVVLLSLLTASCQQPVNNNERKTIVVTYSILGSIVKDLVGNLATVVVSIPNGLDPHEWEPSAQDIATIYKADYIIQNGLDLEAGMQKTLQEAKDKGIKFFTATDYIQVRHVKPGEGVSSGDPDQEVGAPDPHFWTDPLSMKSVVVSLATALKNDLNLDISQRAIELENQLVNLNDDVTNILAPVPPENRKLVTGHESMGYFADRYGFTVIGVLIPSLSSQAEVSAGELAALKKAIIDNHVKVIFTELGTSPLVAEAIGSETNIEVVELTTHALPPDGSYFTFVNNIASVIASTL
jgi:zinc/manganese transport system substrate-binding protein